MSSLFNNLVGNLSKREVLAFKVGGWSSLPIDYAIENYALPYAEKNFSEKGFYNKISQFGARKSSSRSLLNHKKPIVRKSTLKMPANKYPRNQYALNKRLRRVEAMARNNRAEMKTITWTSSGVVGAGTQSALDFTQISSGTAINEREGNYIKVWRVEIRGFSPSQLDHYIIQKHGTTTPVFADFGTGAYAFIDDGVNNTRYTEWLSFRNYDVSTTAGTTAVANIREVLKFPKGIVVKYDDSVSAPVQNGLVYVVRNTTAVDQSQNLSLCMWYTDH